METPEQPILNFDSLCNDDYWIIAVPDESWETKVHAIGLMLDQSECYEWYWWTEDVSDEIPWWVLARIALHPDTRFLTLAKHELPPWEEDPDRGCQCEDEGWWCSQAPGPTWKFYEVERSVIHRLGDDLYARMDALGLTE